MIYLDTVGIKFLANELNENLKGNRINKINAYDKNSFSIFCGKKNIYFDNSLTAIVFLSSNKLRNTEYTSSFILKLKKYLIGGYIREVYAKKDDRIICFKLEKMDIVGKLEKYELIYELLGKEVNVLLVDENRMILANMYVHLKTKRKNIANSNYIFPEPVNKYGKYMAKLPNEQLEKFEKTYEALIFSNGLLTYNKFLDMPYEKFSSLNEALTEYFLRNSSISSVENKKRKILKFVLGNIKRIKSIQNKIDKDITKNLNYEIYKQKADILLANLYKIKLNTQEITLLNYYTNEDITIKLDNSLSPSKNVEKFYQKYAKGKRTIEILNKRKEELKKELEYFIEQQHYVEIENDILGLEEIEKELGIIKKDKIRSTKQSKRELYSVEYKDAIIYVGRNSFENDKLTFEIAKYNDLWLHIKDVPGPHVIIKATNITDDIIEYAAKLAVKNSKNKTYGLVDYCLKKYVKKIHGAKKGQVIYTNYKTIMVE